MPLQILPAFLGELDVGPLVADALGQRGAGRTQQGEQLGNG
jgi:hypothetical protein